MKKILIFMSALMLVASASGLRAADEDFYLRSGEDFQKVAAAGAQFLKIGVGARGQAMGGAYGSLADDLTAVYWNPAGVSRLDGMAFTAAYLNWFGGFNHTFAGMAMPINEQFNVAVSFISFGVDDIEITTMDVPEGYGSTYSITDVALGLTFSGYLTKEFAFGVTAKYVRNSFASLGAQGVAFDIGSLYDTGIYGIKLGFSLHNLGTEMTYDGVDLNTTVNPNPGVDKAPLDARYMTDATDMPIIFRAGASADVFEKDEHKVIGSFDFLTLSDTPEQFAFGAEYTWNKIFSVRGGYRFGHDQLGVSAGAGINYIGGGFDGKINYSINPTKDLGLLNRIEVSVALD